MTTRQKSPRRRAPVKPTGADAVREALIKAAASLIEKRGSTDVSLREIARTADVNHGLVHRHFGTKTDVLVAVFGRQSLQGAIDFTGADGIDAALESLYRNAGTELYARLLASALLENIDPAAIAAGHSFRELLALQERSKPPRRRKRTRIEPASALMAALSLLLGWKLFGPFFVASAGAEKDGDRSDEMLAVLEAIVDLSREK